MSEWRCVGKRSCTYKSRGESRPDRDEPGSRGHASAKSLRWNFQWAFQSGNETSRFGLAILLATPRRMKSQHFSLMREKIFFEWRRDSGRIDSRIQGPTNIFLASPRSPYFIARPRRSPAPRRGDRTEMGPRDCGTAENTIFCDILHVLNMELRFGAYIA